MGASLSKPPLVAIVDDDISFRQAATNFIRSLGYVPAAYASAEEFLASERALQSDCLITDLQMPGMTGIELQRNLLARGCRMPIIFITAFVDPKTRGQALAAGAVCFLGKPFNDDTLIACLHEALAGGSA
jgi:FixJ family two-component response regulator